MIISHAVSRNGPTPTAFSAAALKKYPFPKIRLLTTAFCLAALYEHAVQALRSASRFSIIKLDIGEPPSSSGKNHVNLHESVLRLSAVNGIPTGPGTSVEGIKGNI